MYLYRHALFPKHQKITYQELEERANKIANWAIQKGYKRGDVVSLLMENRPEYIIFWYGFSKIGATIALLNSPPLINWIRGIAELFVKKLDEEVELEKTGCCAAMEEFDAEAGHGDKVYSSYMKSSRLYCYTEKRLMWDREELWQEATETKDY